MLGIAVIPAASLQCERPLQCYATLVSGTIRFVVFDARSLAGSPGLGANDPCRKYPGCPGTASGIGGATDYLGGSKPICFEGGRDPKFISLTWRVGSRPTNRTKHSQIVSTSKPRMRRRAAPADSKTSTYLLKAAACGTQRGSAAPFGRSSPYPRSTRPRCGHRASPRSAWRWRVRGRCRPGPW